MNKLQLQGCIEFWQNYSAINEPAQDEISDAKDAMLETMRGWLTVPEDTYIKQLESDLRKRLADCGYSRDSHVDGIVWKFFRDREESLPQRLQPSEE